MANQKFIAKVDADIKAPVEKVWDALVNPAIIEKYMFGTNVTSDWKAGSTIQWKGEWEGKPYTDHGKILVIDPHHRLQYTHISGSSRKEADVETTHQVTIQLNEEGNHTHISLEQDNNANEEAKVHSEKNWKMMLDGMSKLLEKR